jgi:hypothetical protein
MQSEVMDCFTAFAMTSLFMESAAKPSITPDCMDRRASLAMTGRLMLPP